MIDKFAELRDTREKIEDENKNKCYICSADKAEVYNKNIVGIKKGRKIRRSFIKSAQFVELLFLYV